MKIRKFQGGGYALTYAAPATTGGAISLTELMAPYFSSAVTKLYSLASSAAPATAAVAIPVALTASGIYGTKANQKQVEKGMMPFITSPHAALGYQQTYISPKKEATVPSEPLVLKPEYRTESHPFPLNLFGYKPMFSEQKSGESVQQTGTVAEETAAGGTPDPENDKDKKIKKLKEELEQLKSKLKKPESKPKKPKEYYDSEKDLSWRAPMSSTGKFLFKSRGPGEYTPFRTFLEYSPAWAPIVYYGGKALGWWGENSNNSSNEIDREGTEQAWEDMKVGRKPGQ